MNFQTEKFSNIHDALKPMLQQHFNEVESFKDSMPFDLDEDAYNILEQCGVLHITTAREDTKLVGYAAYCIVPSLHHYGHIIAESDAFFLLPQYRKGLCGVNLLQYAEKELVLRGVHCIVQRVKTRHDCGNIFVRMGYAHAENVLIKVV